MNRKIFTIALILALAGISSARYISISTSVSVENLVRGDTTQVGVKLLNSGDEPAYDVRLSLLLPEGFSADELTPGRLDPEKPYTGNFTVNIAKNVISGSYPIVILTDYRDANSYPFSSVTLNSLNIRERTSSDIFGVLSRIRMSPDGSAVTTLRIRNRGNEKHKLKVRFFLPKELEVRPEHYELEIGPRAQKELKFKISSFGALTGSTYVVFASIDYDEDNLHYSSTASGTVEIVNEDELPPASDDGENPLEFLEKIDLTLWLLLGSFLLLLIVFAGLLIRSRLEGKKNEKQQQDLSDHPDT